MLCPDPGLLRGLLLGVDRCLASFSECRVSRLSMATCDFSPLLGELLEEESLALGSPTSAGAPSW